MPRHSPCALISLTIKELCSSRNNCIFTRLISFKYCRINILICITYFCITLFNFQATMMGTNLESLFRFGLYDFVVKCLTSVLLGLFPLVGTSGLEPPTSRLSGVRSNHLSYAPISLVSAVPSSHTLWWRWGGSNSWPPACKAGALPAELHPHLFQG